MNKQGGFSLIELLLLLQLIVVSFYCAFAFITYYELNPLYNLLSIPTFLFLFIGVPLFIGIFFEKYLNAITNRILFIIFIILVPILSIVVSLKFLENYYLVGLSIFIAMPSLALVIYGYFIMEFDGLDSEDNKVGINAEQIWRKEEGEEEEVEKSSQTKHFAKTGIFRILLIPFIIGLLLMFISLYFIIFSKLEGVIILLLLGVLIMIPFLLHLFIRWRKYY